MIVSASRRTDIPNYYSEWFFNRVREGYLYVRNPMNPHQISKIVISPDVVDCIVFWTKNPNPMLARLGELDSYHYYFQFTLTGYGKDIEANVPHKKNDIIPIFQKLSQRIGKERVIWRYDPILFTERYAPEYHLRAFAQIAEKLRGYTAKAVISIVDTYAKNKKALRELGSYSLPENELLLFAGEIAAIARANDMKPASCAESIDLSVCGIEHNCCIDRELIEQLAGYTIRAGKDRNQRRECGCIESIEIGTYHTCRNGCRYCYANGSPSAVARTSACYDANSPLLCGSVTGQDNITERKVKSFRV